MKIVTRDAFMAMPGTLLYSEFRPVVFEAPHIRYPASSPTNAATLEMVPIDTGDDKIFRLLLRAAEGSGESVPLDYTLTGDGEFYDGKQLYAVYEPDDIRALIARLRECLPVEQV